MKFSKFDEFFQLKKPKIDQKTKFFFRDRPARWRARRMHFNSRMRLAKGFFLPFIDANSVHRQRRPASGTASGTATGRGSPEGFLQIKIHSEYIIQANVTTLVEIGTIRIDVGCLFLEIGIFREFSKK